MRLQAKPIITWNNVNSYVFGNQWIVNSGDPLKLYFQLIDIDQAIQGNNQGIGIFSGITPVGTTAGLRYLAGIGSQNQPYQVKVTFSSIDQNNQLTLTATQADAADNSIWYVTIQPNMIVAGGNVQFSVYEGNNIRRFNVLNLLSVQYPNGDGMC